MFKTIIPFSSKMSLRAKARLNICIAKDLADNFGGKKADYLKRLNRKVISIRKEYLKTVP